MISSFSAFWTHSEENHFFLSSKQGKLVKGKKRYIFAAPCWEGLLLICSSSICATDWIQIRFDFLCIRYFLPKFLVPFAEIKKIVCLFIWFWDINFLWLLAGVQLMHSGSPCNLYTLTLHLIELFLFSLRKRAFETYLYD